VEHCVRTDYDVSPNQDKDSYAEYQESETELSQTSNWNWRKERVILFLRRRRRETGLLLWTSRVSGWKWRKNAELNPPKPNLQVSKHCQMRANLLRKVVKDICWIFLSLKYIPCRQLILTKIIAIWGILKLLLLHLRQSLGHWSKCRKPEYFTPNPNLKPGTRKHSSSLHIMMMEFCNSRWRAADFNTTY
jgi:hypothetical protein